MYSANPIRGFSSIILFLFSFIPSLTYSDPRITEAGLSCGAARNPNSSTFVHNFITNMESLSQVITAHQWGTFVTGASSEAPVYGLSECISDLSPTDCLLCFAQCRTKIPRCLPFISGRLYLDGCFVRYDNYSFFAETIDEKHDRVNCSGGMVNGKSGRAEMLKNLEVVVNDVIKMAVDNEGFGVGKSGVDKKGVVELYGLGQCWKSVGKEGCRACLEKAAREVKGCLPANEGRGLNAGCYLRYSTAKFFGDVKMVEGENRDSDVSRRTRVILLVTCSLFLFALLALLGFFVGYRRLASKKQANKHVGRLYSAVDKSNLNFKYETLEKATDFFNTSRKLGQGGAGSVYKGILRDGRNIAVKRLFFNTRQWVDEFFNEVNLISGVQHKNLVKLLGCSIEGPESLLVYEYVPNKSLDHFLFDKHKTLSLNWQQRFDIIVGTAEGLAYLHEGSATKIIHRDIKSSNVLLDENLQAKIADFGLARCVGADKTHLSTGIAGTLGYMAPEYLVRGQLTEKADVYSFGVLVLEIVCGRKNSVYIDESGSLLHMVWKHYKSNTLVETVEECLRDNFPPKLASDVLHIGLLCTQASVSLRPSMSEVVQMLTKKHCSIPSPMQPPFLNASVLDPNSSTNSTSIPFSSSPATTDGLMTPKSDLR